VMPELAGSVTNQLALISAIKPLEVGATLPTALMINLQRETGIVVPDGSCVAKAISIMREAWPCVGCNGSGAQGEGGDSWACPECKGTGVNGWNQK
jgi:hypothetical protein